MSIIIPANHPQLDERTYSGSCPVCEKAPIRVSAGQGATCSHCGITGRAEWVEPEGAPPYLFIETPRGKDE